MHRRREHANRDLVAAGGRQRRQRIFLILASAILGLAGAAFAMRLVTDQTGRRVNIPEHPRRLVSLAPSITETLYALGLSDELVGDTDYCEYPPEAKKRPHVGSLLNPSLERIVALKPDLVLGSPSANRVETAEQLERLGIPLYGVTATSVDGMLLSIDDLGRVLGCEAAAQRLVSNLRARLEAVENKVAGRARPKVLFVVWYRPLTTAGPHTFISDVIRLAGGSSISDDLKGEWPRLSLEEALRRDPDVILFPRSASFAPDLAGFQRLPGWREFRAVRQHRMYFVSDSIVRPSPRLIDALEEVARLLHPQAGIGREPKP
jgi:iron complex transport system substrate-binding protein